MPRAPGSLHFPGFHIEATQMLLEETNRRRMAVDTLSLDHGPSRPISPPITPGCRRAATGSNASRGSTLLPAAGATLMVGAPKVRGGTGGPARVMALV
jgi:kynurenine formamidase